jgi:hypothetical protein
VAYSGDVGRAIDIIDFLMTHWATYNGNVVQLGASLDATFRLVDTAHEVAFLLAWSADDGPHLAKWESSKGFAEGQGDFSSIGSLGSYHVDLTPAWLRRLAEAAVPQEEVLPALTALVQSFGIHDNLIDHHVGGAVVGLTVGPMGPTWQTDTGYLLYSRHGLEPEFISAFVRDNALVVHSSITKEHTAMLTAASGNAQQWLAKWDPQVVAEFGTDHFPIVVFLRREDKLITVLKRDLNRSGYIKLDRVGDVLNLSMRSDIGLGLREILEQDLESSGNEPPFKVIFLREAQ